MPLSLFQQFLLGGETMRADLSCRQKGLPVGWGGKRGAITRWLLAIFVGMRAVSALNLALLLCLSCIIYLF